tara:strand:- start:59 stop:784 length:726 start_codon:yes stop_codon:yes gene_type:complete
MSKSADRFFKLSYWLRKFYVSKFSNFFFSKEKIRKNAFRHIYLSNHWQNYFALDLQKSRSGPGSNLKYTSDMSRELEKFFVEKNIKTILDIGCGDFIWMNLLLNKYYNYDKYLGLDIVDELIKNNNLKYSNDKISFKTFDLVKDEIPKGFDIILIRDVFIHLKNEQIVNFLNLLKNLDIKFFGVTSTPSLKKNNELKAVGRYRDINIEIEPFNLKDFLHKIDEKNNNDTLNIYEIKKHPVI